MSTSRSFKKGINWSTIPQDQASEGPAGPNWLLLYCLLYAWSSSRSSKRAKFDLLPQDQASEGPAGQIDLLLCCLLYAWPTSRSSFERAEIDLLYLKIKLQKGQLRQVELLLNDASPLAVPWLQAGHCWLQRVKLWGKNIEISFSSEKSRISSVFMRLFARTLFFPQFFCVWNRTCCYKINLKTLKLLYIVTSLQIFT